MVYFVVLALGCLVVGVGVPLAVGRASEQRWGQRKLPPVDVGQAPYRDRPVQDERANGAPWSIRATAVCTGIWGILTMLAFAPAGLVFVALGFQENVLATPLVLLVSLHGFFLAARLIAAGRRLLAREDLAKVASLPKHALLHHLAVVVSFVLSGMWMGTWELALLPMVPCILGAALSPAISSSLRKAQTLPGTIAPPPSDAWSKVSGIA